MVMQKGELMSGIWGMTFVLCLASVIWGLNAWSVALNRRE
jgi:hypothetical protein